TNGNGQGGHVSDPSGKALFSIVDGGSDMTVRQHRHNTESLNGVSLNITALKAKSKQSTAPSATHMYLRFRIHGVPTHFYRVGISQGDRIFLSSSQQTEIIDFRLNVRRG